MKKCTTCKNFKPDDKFSVMKNGKLNSVCKICRAENTRAYYAAHKKERGEAMKQYHIKNPTMRKRTRLAVYGLTYEQYVAMLEHQSIVIFIMVGFQ